MQEYLNRRKLGMQVEQDPYTGEANVLPIPKEREQEIQQERLYSQQMAGVESVSKEQAFKEEFIKAMQSSPEAQHMVDQVTRGVGEMVNSGMQIEPSHVMELIQEVQRNASN